MCTVLYTIDLLWELQIQAMETILEDKVKQPFHRTVQKILSNYHFQ